MSCSDRYVCGSGCKCGSSCKCGSGCKCGSCQMYPDFMEGNTSSETFILGVAPQDVKTDVSGLMMGSENGGCGCKCGSSCTCYPCTCKK